MNKLLDEIQSEIDQADDLIRAGRLDEAFRRLERAHVLGQSSTYQHTRIHLRMLRLGFRMHNVREIFGQVIRVIGAATKTPFRIYPPGNTGGANVWFFKSMPIPDDLKKFLDEAT